MHVCVGRDATDSGRPFSVRADVESCRYRTPPSPVGKSVVTALSYVLVTQKSHCSSLVLLALQHTYRLETNVVHPTMDYNPPAIETYGTVEAKTEKDHMDTYGDNES